MPAPIPAFRTRTMRAIVLGAPGILALVILLDPPEGVPAAALALNPALLLVLAALGGAWAAPRIRLRSAIVLDGRRPQGGWTRFVAFGVALGMTVAFGDRMLAPLWQGRGGPPDLLAGAGPASILLGVLYGGLTEEVVMRWGLLGLIAAALIRLAPRPVALRLAAALAAILFAASHLPVLALQEVEITHALVARTFGFNLLLGFAFGWACLRGGLEGAIGAHVGFHMGVGCAALAAIGAGT